MKRFFLSFVCLGIVLTFLLGQFSPSAISSAQDTELSSRGSLATGEFDSIVLDFRETPQVLSHLSDSLSFLSQRFNVKPVLNSEFSEADHIYIAPGDLTLLKELQNSDLAAQTEFIEPNYIYSLKGFSVNDPDFDKQWNFRLINAEGAWAQGATGQGVTVAVIDTGISQGPDLSKTKFAPGYDFVNDRADASDDHGHGTHVAGTVAQSTNNGFGVAGVAFKAKLMPLKVLSRSGSGAIADIAEAIRFAADNGADVINMSLGGGGESKLMREAIDYAHSKGVVIVAAAGNEGRAQASYPARYPNVIAVSAIGPDRQKTFYSNYGQGVDIAAPGGATQKSQLDGILQETIDPRDSGEFLFRYFQGTSMASPHVAGVAALVKSRDRSLTPDQVWEVLKASAQPVENDSQNYFGVGYLDAEKAVKMVSWVWFEWRSLDWKGIGLKLAIAAALTGFLIPRSRQFNPWNLTFLLGIMFGSIGIFVLKAIHISAIPHWPLRLMGSSIPELGGALWNDPTLNPIFASLLIPFGLMTLLISHRDLKWMSLGTAIGTTAFLAVAAFDSPISCGLALAPPLKFIC